MAIREISLRKLQKSWKKFKNFLCRGFGKIVRGDLFWVNTPNFFGGNLRKLFGEIKRNLFGGKFPNCLGWGEFLEKFDLGNLFWGKVFFF